MRRIEIEEDIYEHLCRNTVELGESASIILRRLLKIENQKTSPPIPAPPGLNGSHASNGSVLNSVLSRSLAAQTPVTPAVRQIQTLTQPPAAIQPPVVAMKEGRVAALLQRLSRLRTKQVIDRFMVIMEWIHDLDPAKFECVHKIRGRTRVYFSRSKRVIEDSGNSTFPVEIGRTGWFVSTNTSTKTKRDMLEELLHLRQFPRDEREAVLAALEPGGTPPTASSAPTGYSFSSSNAEETDDDLTI